MTDIRDTCDALSEAVNAALVIVDRVNLLAAGADVEVRFSPHQGEPFTEVGEEQDTVYVATRMAERRAQKITAAIALSDSLKAALQALLAG